MTEAEVSSETSVQRHILRKSYLHGWVLLEKDRGLGEMCVIEYCSVRVILCLAYLVVFYAVSSSLGCTRF